MVRLRMQRFGRRNRPFYRISAIDQRTRRDGRVIEQLGWYDPMASDKAKTHEINADRVKYWLSVGAQPSDTVMDMLGRMGIIQSKAWEERRARDRKRVEDRKAKEAAAAAAGAEEKKA